MSSISAPSNHNGVGEIRTDAVQMPSQVYNFYNSAEVRPQMIDTPAQQGAPEPGSGTTVRVNENVPFKDKMIGYAKYIRGTVLGKTETKAIGEKIISGQMSARDYFDQKKK